MIKDREAYLAHLREYASKRYKDRRANHQCIRCGKKTSRTESGRVFCLQCAIMAGVYTKRYAEKVKQKKSVEEGDGK